ncbi:MAG: heavy metal translocating P-type ATPase, partial [Clostridia bacterium]|nr:heavy metal translocating P-type ATPase [Clostridia bacterium]
MDKYSVGGMSCAACSARVEKAVSSVEGVKSCSVNLLTNSMLVEGEADKGAVINAVEKAGYTAKSVGDKKTDKNSDLDDKTTTSLIKRLIWSIIFLIVLMYFSMGHTMWNFQLPSFFEHNHIAIGITQMLLTVIVMIINQKFFTSGFRAIIKRSPNMDSLIALGSSAGFIYSTYSLFKMTVVSPDEAMNILHNGFYFESSAMILTLITVGKTLESFSKGKTTNALKSLMSLQAKTVKTIRDGKEITIPIEQISVGDEFVIYPGESVAVDGIVLEGESAVDESALTGESIPTDKAVGDKVSSGTINKSGFLRCKAVKVGEDTTISQIIKMVNDASTSKAPIAKIADKVSGIFVPAVIAIAIVTFVCWLFTGQSLNFALARAISVLVISCPCALGLATPVAIMVGNGIGAKNGILFKNATALENLGKSDIVVLDKTGTITKGEPKVTDIIPCGSFLEKDLITIALSLEQKSEHPLAKAIVDYSNQNQINAFETENFKVLSGNGISAQIDKKTYFGGSYKFIGQKVK